MPFPAQLCAFFVVIHIPRGVASPLLLSFMRMCFSTACAARSTKDCISRLSREEAPEVEEEEEEEVDEKADEENDEDEPPIFLRLFRRVEDGKEEEEEEEKEEEEAPEGAPPSAPPSPPPSPPSPSSSSTSTNPFFNDEEAESGLRNRHVPNPAPLLRSTCSGKWFTMCCCPNDLR